MARNDSGLVGLAVSAAVALVGYKLAEMGTFGPSGEKLAENIAKVFSGTAKAAGGSGGTSKTIGGGSSGGSGGVKAPMIAGQRYVAPYGDGFIVVWDGQNQGVFGTQALAEQAYNTFAETRLGIR